MFVFFILRLHHGDFTFLRFNFLRLDSVPSLFEFQPNSVVEFDGDELLPIRNLFERVRTDDQHLRRHFSSSDVCDYFLLRILFAEKLTNFSFSC